MRFDTLSEMQIDALRETGSIGAGHAATALSQLVGHAISIDVPTLEVLDVGEVPELFGGPRRSWSASTSGFWATSVAACSSWPSAPRPSPSST